MSKQTTATPMARIELFIDDIVRGVGERERNRLESEEKKKMSKKTV